jgi:hypothetical protein
MCVPFPPAVREPASSQRRGRRAVRSAGEPNGSVINPPSARNYTVEQRGEAAQNGGADAE